ncbi:glycine zipper 2TM domain-containing protein [Azospirillum sp. TSH58]|uniref:glycine zipper 2TM domain-containing protein n=1 Tax=Azospirillum sp. TSH58 TaxID=664962 RepID=UPI000D6434FC|nr:glycine zipper 2TM domain-containing protein [Azospirillum sp. TSH58]
MKAKTFGVIAAVVCVPLVLSGCQTTKMSSAECRMTGTGLGAFVGGIAGAALFGQGGGKIVAGLAGAAVGALIGNQIGSMLDCQDQQAVVLANQQAGNATTGNAIYWTSTTGEKSMEDFRRTQSAPIKLANAPAPKKPTPAKASSEKQKDRSVQSSATAKAGGKATAANDPWAIQEPIKSAGQSGMWGWTEPVSDPAMQADGRLCRDLKQTVVDPQGNQTSEVVKSCQDDQQRWTVVSR